MSETLKSVLSGNTALNSHDLNLRKENAGASDPHPDKENQIRLIKEQKSLWRLNSVLAGDKPLKENVPRGYYLNITV